MTEVLPQAEWLDGPRTAAVFDALEAAGGTDCARFVGGCVRNALIGQPVDDVDIATRLIPEAVVAGLRAAGLKAVPTGMDHGTVTAVSGGRPFEITTLRRDVATDGRHAVVAYTEDWEEDARRRDFTLNALYARRDGTVLDPTGRGVNDGEAGRIVFVGDPEQRVREDYLRILRFFRFLAWYGRGEPDAAALAACAALKGGIAALSAERVSKELLKLLAAPDPRRAMELMAQTGVWPVIAPQARDMARFKGLVAIDAGAGEPILRLAALLPDDPALGLATAGRLRLSNADRDRLAAALAPAPELAPGLGATEARRLLYVLGAPAFRDRAKLAWANDPDHAAAWRALIAQADGWTRPALPVSGADAMALGAPKGPQVGQALHAVEAWWIGEDFPADRGRALERLKAVVREMRS